MEEGIYRLGLLIFYPEHPAFRTRCEREVEIRFYKEPVPTPPPIAPAVEEQPPIDEKLRAYREELLPLYQSHRASMQANDKRKQKENVLKTKIDSIDHFGRLHVKFSRNIQFVPNLDYLNNGTIYLDELQLETRQLDALSNDTARERIPVLQVDVLPGQEQDLANVKFTWNVTMQNNRTMDVRLYFETPGLISSTLTPDYL